MQAYVFPSQGTQKKGMGKALFAEFRTLVAQADDVLGYSIETLCLEDPDRLLQRTEYAQPAIYVVNALHHRKELARNPEPPRYLAGHSLGEYNALLAAEVFDFATGLKLVKRRGEAMGRVDGGGMAAIVGASEKAIDDALKKHAATGVTIANYNTPGQFVLSGGRNELERLQPIFEKLEGIRAFVHLKTSGAFHSPHMASARREFQTFLETVPFAEPKIPVISNVTALPYGASDIRPLLAAQITEPVRWADSIQYLRHAGVSRFVELGESKMLTSLIEKIPAREAPADQRGAFVSTLKEQVFVAELGEAARHLDAQRPFKQLGLDSIRYIRLARKVEAVFGIPCRPDALYSHGTCAALADHLMSKKAAQMNAATNARWNEYRDERVLALLRDCAQGTVSIEKAVKTIRERI